jgi:hypothetical protein
MLTVPSPATARTAPRTALKLFFKLLRMIPLLLVRVLVIVSSKRFD